MKTLMFKQSGTTTIHREHKPTAAPNQRGFASIAIALVMILVLALITVGFSQLTRREQQSALSRHLSAQADYAAESAINDAYEDVITPGATFTGLNSNACYDSGTPGNKIGNIATEHLTTNSSLSSSSNIEYSCVLVNPTPPSVEVTSLAPFNVYSTNFSTVNPTTKLPDPINSLNISWGSSDGSANFAAPFSSLPTSSVWNSAKYAPVLKVSFTPLPDLLGSYNRAGLLYNNFSVLLYPSTGSSNSIGYVTGGGTNYGAIVPGNCTASPATVKYSCNATISGIAPPAGTIGDYTIQIEPLYDSANISMTGTDALPSPQTVDFSNSQVLIDATGRAKDVLKRLEVRVPLNGNGSGGNNLPSDALEAQDICKRFNTNPPIASNPGDPGTTYDPSSPVCDFGNN